MEHACIIPWTSSVVANIAPMSIVCVCVYERDPSEQWRELADLADGRRVWWQRCAEAFMAIMYLSYKYYALQPMIESSRYAKTVVCLDSSRRCICVRV